MGGRVLSCALKGGRPELQAGDWLKKCKTAPGNREGKTLDYFHHE